MDLQDLIEVVKSGAEGNFEDFTEPDEDLTTALFLGTSSGVQIIALPSWMINDNDAKEIVGYLIYPKLARQMEATMFVFVSSTYMVEFRADKEDEEKWKEEVAVYEEWRKENPGSSLSEWPGHLEKVIVYGSDGEENISWAAKINRHHPHPPTLDEWKEMPDMTQSRLVGPIRAAIRDNRGLTQPSE